MGKLGRGSWIVGLTLLAAACAPAPKPIVVAPKPVAPPPVVPATPPMPLPPGGAAVTMKVPMIGADAPVWLLLAGVVAFGATIGNFITTHSLLLAQAFGVAAYPRLYGLARVISVAGVLCGPGLMGVLYKHQHSYAGAFMAAGLVSLLGGLALAAAGRDPHPGQS